MTSNIILALWGVTATVGIGAILVFVVWFAIRLTRRRNLQ
jgi:uncharacterized membrane protein (Fun14 family)